MTSNNQILNVTVGESLREAGNRAVATMKAVARGEKVQPHFGVNFEQIGQMLAAFTPKRWELIAALRQAGPLTVAELARRLGRDYKNVHTDVNQLIEWMAVERGDDGRVYVPWSEIVVDMKLPERVVA
ncbi:MAG: MarR family transcriptional regulator [Polaromonas sp.]|uniref:HVO_A0114 family putative DNA-binding protein n=1 Tax=Polaromonas sp. TaxID=1869339 RepID=UPI002734AA64|nr:MarR family transcriptional regulator [Polaromonas sp.]MDP2818527.1 MarR family transcriptional regulator [Polaromonas sp.]